MQRLDMWCDSLFSFDLSDVIDTDIIFQHYLRVREKFPAGQLRSNMGGWQQQISKFECEELDKLFFEVEKNLFKLSNEIFNMDEIITLDNAWFNANVRGNYNSRHSHPGALIAGVFYVKQKPEYGNIRFYRHENFSYAIHSSVSENYMTSPWIDKSFKLQQTITPSQSELIFFPGWIEHDVTPNQTDEERLIIAMNFSAKTTLKSHVL